MQTLTDHHKLVRRSDPVTSHEAAQQVLHFQEAHHSKILAALKRLGGRAGAEEIAWLSELDPYAVRKRLPELARLGYVRVVSDETRRTSTGRSERVWAAV